MKINDLNNYFKTISSIAHENFLEFECSFIPDRNVCVSTFDALGCISPRDTFELTVTIDGNIESIDNCDTAHKERILALFGPSRAEQAEATLTIYKKKQGSRLSIYSIDEFSKYLNTDSIHNTIVTFNRNFNETLTFEVCASISEFGSETIKFMSASSGKAEASLSKIENRAEILETFNQSKTFGNLDIQLLPDDFSLSRRNGECLLTQYFDNVCALLSLIFLSNSLSVDTTINKFKLEINGYRNISQGNLEINKLAKSSRDLFLIYRWAYEGGHSADKIGLVRNVLSIHSSINSHGIKIESGVFAAVKSNYQIYLKKNIKSYLDVKNKINEAALVSAEKASSIADELLSAVKTSFIGMLSFIISTVVVNGMKTQAKQPIFSYQYLLLAFILVILSFCWLCFLRRDIIVRYVFISKNILRTLEKNYSDIIVKSEISNLIKPIIRRNRKFLIDQRKKYTAIWVIALVLFFVIYLAATLISENPDLFSAKNQIPTESSSAVVRVPLTVNPKRNTSESSIIVGGQDTNNPSVNFSDPFELHPSFRMF